MTVEEAIEEVRFNMSHIGLGARAARRVKEAKEMAILALEQVQKYRAIGTVSEFRELKEKATAKKPIDVRYFAEAGYSIGLCPTCNSGINSEFKYCGDCCQHLDWSEGKE